MNWLVFVAINVFTDAFRIFLDNYISDYYFKGRNSVSQKLYHGVFYIVFALIVLPLCGAHFDATPFVALLPFVVAGFISGLGGIPYYKALELDDSTNLGIFIQLAPILYLIAGWLFLGETISPLQLIAFVIIISAPLLILFTTRKRSRGVKLRAIAFASLYVLLAVIGNSIFVNFAKSDVAQPLGFMAEIALFFLGNGIMNLLIVFVRPRLYKRFVTIMRRHPKKMPRLMFANGSLSIVASLTYRLALATAPTMALASAASDSSEPIVIFFMGIILTLVQPKFGREKLNRKSILIHLIASVLVVIGIVLLQSF